MRYRGYVNQCASALRARNLFEHQKPIERIGKNLGTALAVGWKYFAIATREAVRCRPLRPLATENQAQVLGCFDQQRKIDMPEGRRRPLATVTYSTLKFDGSILS